MRGLTVQGNSKTNTNARGVTAQGNSNTDSNTNGSARADGVTEARGVTARGVTAQG